MFFRIISTFAAMLLASWHVLVETLKEPPLVVRRKSGVACSVSVVEKISPSNGSNRGTKTDDNSGM